VPPGRAFPDQRFRRRHVCSSGRLCGGRDKESCMNIEKYTERARGFIQSAQTLALGRNHQQFAPVHLLKVLLDDDQGMANGLIERAGGTPKLAQAEVEAALAKIPSVSGDGSQLYLSRELARLRDTAATAAQKAGARYVTAGPLLRARVGGKVSE